MKKSDLGFLKVLDESLLIFRDFLKSKGSDYFSNLDYVKSLIVAINYIENECFNLYYGLDL